MAGGVGSRFWPMSRTSYPKQFLDFLGTGESLLQMTVRRIKKICPEENIYIVTNELYKEATLEQLPSFNADQVLCEPARRNTAPCVAYASVKIHAKNPNANIFVAAADHLIVKEDEFVSVVNEAMAFTTSNDALVTFGIEPTRPDTGYGYIQFDQSSAGNVKPVKNFTEKPDLETAESFLSSGDYSWNSGMFIWSSSSILRAMEKHLTEVYHLFHDGMDIMNTEDESAFIKQVYPICPDVSIDYGVMEKAENVYVISADIGWSDLGTWGSVYTHLKHDSAENAVSGDNVMMYDSRGCMVNVPENKLAVIQGLEDYIVVESNNTLLICKKQNEQMIKQFVSDVKEQKGEDYV